MQLIVNDNIFDVKCVFTEKDIQNGMKNKKFDDFDGMLFIMNGNYHNFWMKDCIIPLDIIFINDNLITKIHHDCNPCKTETCKTYSGNGDLVLELPGGSCKKYKINEGDSIFLE
jgi:uncharacterized membrane protein (UPF0127 family)